MRIHRKLFPIFLFITVFSIVVGQGFDLSPLRWGEGEIDKYVKICVYAKYVHLLNTYMYLLMTYKRFI